MTIAFITNFFEFRNDTRKIARIIARDHKVIFYIKEKEKKNIRFDNHPEFEFRVINERKSTPKNRFLEYCFLLFKKLPSTRNNYFLMELFKATHLDNKTDRIKAKLYLFLQRILPRAMSYDTLLDQLDYSAKTLIDDVDLFIYQTELHDDYLIARLIREHKNVKAYVYSWDHPCKHARFSKRLSYLVWSEGIKNDLISIQQISPANIHVIGSTQLCYVEKFMRNHAFQKQPSDSYVYYACAVGIKGIRDQEVQVIAHIAELLQTERPKWKLVVRPYPQMKEPGIYAPLKRFENVVFDNAFETGIISMTDEQIMHKFKMVSQCKLFLHTGTTLGLEAAFFNAPSCMVDMAGNKEMRLSIYHFVHQYQNDKYVISDNSHAVITGHSDLKNILSAIDSGSIVNFNSHITDHFPVSSFEEMAARFVACK